VARERETAADLVMDLLCVLTCRAQLARGAFHSTRCGDAERLAPPDEDGGPPAKFRPTNATVVSLAMAGAMAAVCQGDLLVHASARAGLLGGTGRDRVWMIYRLNQDK